jgi:hypothetical protein
MMLRHFIISLFVTLYAHLAKVDLGILVPFCASGGAHCYGGLEYRSDPC